MKQLLDPTRALLRFNRATNRDLLGVHKLLLVRMQQEAERQLKDVSSSSVRRGANPAAADFRTYNKDDQEVAGYLRVALAYTRTNQLDAVMVTVEKGLEIDPYCQALLELKEQVTVAKANSSEDEETFIDGSATRMNIWASSLVRIASICALMRVYKL